MKTDYYESCLVRTNYYEEAEKAVH